MWKSLIKLVPLLETFRYLCKETPLLSHPRKLDPFQIRPNFASMPNLSADEGYLEEIQNGKMHDQMSQGKPSWQIGYIDWDSQIT